MPFLAFRVLIGSRVRRRSARIFRHTELHDLAIAHLDCDAFYAAIKKRDQPEPRDVAGRPRGAVAACCYIARTYGVRSAMPMFKALKACPEATVIRPDMKSTLPSAARSGR